MGAYSLSTPHHAYHQPLPTLPLRCTLVSHTIHTLGHGQNITLFNGTGKEKLVRNCPNSRVWPAIRYVHRPRDAVENVKSTNGSQVWSAPQLSKPAPKWFGGGGAVVVVVSVGRLRRSAVVVSAYCVRTGDIPIVTLPCAASLRRPRRRHKLQPQRRSKLPDRHGV